MGSFCWCFEVPHKLFLLSRTTFSYMSLANSSAWFKAQLKLCVQGEALPDAWLGVGVLSWASPYPVLPTVATLIQCFAELHSPYKAAWCRGSPPPQCVWWTGTVTHAFCAPSAWTTQPVFVHEHWLFSESWVKGIWMIHLSIFLSTFQEILFPLNDRY